MTRRLAPAATLVFSALALAAPRAEATCTDPPVPDGGFSLVEQTVLVTRSDGYVSWTDVRYPVDPPGACGWPLVMLIHGGGGDKGVVAGAAKQLAAQGYVTCAYDVRGQGPSKALNPASLGHDMTGLRLLIDLFEAMESVEALHPTEVDFARIGVTGYSQGGTHSWWGARHSGLLPPTNPWRAAAFPVVSAVVVKDSTGGLSASQPITAFNVNQVEGLFAPGGIVYQPAVVAALQPLVVAEDFAAFQAALYVPGMDAQLLLPQTTVPVYAHASYDDKRVHPSRVFEAWSLVPDTTPKRFQFGTGGHGSPANSRDTALYTQNRQRWFDRFLKGESNGVDLEPRVFAAVTPDDVADYQAPQALWDFREGDDLPLPGTVTSRRYLGAGGALVDAAPAGATLSTLTHTVPAGFDMAAYTTLLPNANQLAAIIPADSIAYDSASFAEDTHLHGEAVVELSVGTPAADYQVHAVLLDVAPNGDTRFVARGGASVRGQPGASTRTIRTYHQSYVFRAGHRLRLQLENLAVHRPPTGSTPELKLVPTLTSSTVGVLEGGAAPSYVDLPLLPFAGPTLSTDPPMQSVAAPEHQRLAVHSHSGRAGDPYLLLPSLSGTSPTTNVIGVDVPLVFDAVTWLWIANPGLPPFVGAAGLLDATGTAEPGVLLGGLALPPSLIGVELSMAVLVGGADPASTNAVTVPFVP